jgi:hypothetical protein
MPALLALRGRCVDLAGVRAVIISLGPQTTNSIELTMRVTLRVVLGRIHDPRFTS